MVDATLRFILVNLDTKYSVSRQAFTKSEQKVRIVSGAVGFVMPSTERGSSESTVSAFIRSLNVL